MQECETGTGKDSMVKRVTVRSGGAGHAHSGIVNGVTAVSDSKSGNECEGLPERPDNKIVRLGR